MKERKGSIRKGRGWTRLALLALLSTGCGGGGGTEATDTADEGVIHISADESFKPVIDSQVQVYESSHPGAKIIVHYKPEVECLKDFAVDSIRMIIATRGYTPAEGQFIMDSLKVQPSKMVMAHDAIAVIVHPQSPDTLMSMEQVRNLLT
ncbi:MAG TPA: substrate-binding domain-containing protein, partial [Chitinophagaceae bacterium]|nr:substrate-binding domain-containing protein [Chitinophagaceae bacterium]